MAHALFLGHVFDGENMLDATPHHLHAMKTATRQVRCLAPTWFDFSRLRLIAAFGLLIPVWMGAQTPEDHLSISNYNGAATCQSCHTRASRDLMASIHWTWEKTDSETGLPVGKKNVINNYCIALASNEPRCTSCHIGIGWADSSFDFTDKTKLDCLVCHDTTGTYKKTPTGAGQPAAGLNLTAIAQQAGRTSRQTCGACHFFGGGANAVKHGDLDSSMTNPSRDLDVHMGGLGFTCADCHVVDGLHPHLLAGSRYSKAAPDNALCESCHTAQPTGHSAILNRHTARVACQSCHIPTYARGGQATKMYWDWSTAGEKKPDGTEKTIKDAQGNPLYETKKGAFVWAADLTPEYVWFNGKVRFATLDDTIDPEKTLVINVLEGGYDDALSRIVPVKRFLGRQPYDGGTGKLSIPHLFGSDAKAYWKSYDWNLAMQAGQAAVGKTFVGPIAFVETEMTWIQNHMVAPKEQSLQCADCHSYGGRISFAGLGYPPATADELQNKFGPPSLWPETTFPGTGGVKQTGLGLLWDGAYPFVYLFSSQPGWLFIIDNGATLDGFWGYDYTQATWFWTANHLDGVHYALAAGEWRQW